LERREKKKGTKGIDKEGETRREREREAVR